GFERVADRIQRNLLDRAVLADACIVDEDADPSVSAFDRLDRLPTVCLVTNVEFEDLAPYGFQVLDVGGISGGGDGGMPGRPEGAGRGMSEPARAARDQYRPHVLHRRHWKSPDVVCLMLPPIRHWRAALLDASPGAAYTRRVQAVRQWMACHPGHRPVRRIVSTVPCMTSERSVTTARRSTLLWPGAACRRSPTRSWRWTQDEGSA